MHPSSIKSLHDMTALGELNECGILRNLFLRYYNDQIYVRFGKYPSKMFLCRPTLDQF